MKLSFSLVYCIYNFEYYFYCPFTATMHKSPPTKTPDNEIEAVIMLKRDISNYLVIATEDEKIERN